MVFQLRLVEDNSIEGAPLILAHRDQLRFDRSSRHASACGCCNRIAPEPSVKNTLGSQCSSTPPFYPRHVLVEDKQPRASRHSIEGEERHHRPAVAGSHCNSRVVDHREERGAAAGASRRLPRALCPQRSGDLSQDAVPGGLSLRRLHRIPRVVESSARRTARLLRRLPASG
jgi:hypothetical protein